MKTLNISEARNILPALVESVATTRASVLLLRYGKPAAMLVPVEDDAARTNPYPLRGMPISLPDDFDAPLADLWETCEAAEPPTAYGKRASGGKRKGTQA